MGKKRQRIVVVHEDELHEQPPQAITAGPAGPQADEVASSDGSAKRDRRKNSSNKKKKKKRQRHGMRAGSLLQQAVSEPEQNLRVQVVHSTCSECGMYELVRGSLEQRWSSEVHMYGSVIYQLIADRVETNDSGCSPSLRIDACHFEPGGRRLFDVQFQKQGSRVWYAGTLSPDSPCPATRWRLALSDGNTLTLELQASVDWLEIARFDADLPYDTDCRLSVPRTSLRSSVESIAPGLPAELRAALGEAQMRGCGSLFFSGIAFARHLALSSLPAASLLPHAAFLLNLDAAPFKAVKRWTPRTVMDLLRQHGDAFDKSGFRPVYGNVQAKKYTTGSKSETNEVTMFMQNCCSNWQPTKYELD